MQNGLNPFVSFVSLFPPEKEAAYTTAPVKLIESSQPAAVRRRRKMISGTPSRKNHPRKDMISAGVFTLT